MRTDHSLPRFHLDHRLRIDFPFIRKERAETGIIRQFNRFKVIMTGPEARRKPQNRPHPSHTARSFRPLHRK